MTQGGGVPHGYDSLDEYERLTAELRTAAAATAGNGSMWSDSEEESIPVAADLSQRRAAAANRQARKW